MKRGRSIAKGIEGAVEWVSWGTFRVCGKEHAKTEKGKVGVGKDIRVIGRDVTEWKERKGHSLTSSMITGVYDAGIEVLVIGIGVDGAIECPEEVKRSIRERGIARVELRRTPEACQLYNALLRAGKRVALLAHGTC
jgi:hypothetical protein